MLIRSYQAVPGTKATREPGSFRAGLWTAILGAGLSIASCSSSQGVADQSALLASSGFVERFADTAQKQSMLARLPQHTLVRRDWNGKQIYIYAGDPACNCAYLGDESAFARYERNVLRATPQGTAASFVQAQRGSKQNRGVVVREDSAFDPEPWGVGGWRD